MPSACRAIAGAHPSSPFFFLFVILIITQVHVLLSSLSKSRCLERILTSEDTNSQNVNFPSHFQSPVNIDYPWPSSGSSVPFMLSLTDV